MWYQKSDYWVPFMKVGTKTEVSTVWLWAPGETVDLNAIFEDSIFELYFEDVGTFCYIQ